MNEKVILDITALLTYVMDIMTPKLIYILNILPL